MAERRFSFSASLITQGDYKFYSATLPIDILAPCCFVTTREEDPEKGFQRTLDTNRALEIAEYIDSGKATIPTSIVLSAQEDADFSYDPTKKTIRFFSVPKAFLVLDGQHRVYGFRKAKRDLRVPVIIYSGLSRLIESRLFIDINTKQRPVPNELLLDIKKLADYESESEAYSGTLFDLFLRDNRSVLKEYMSPSKRTKGMISRVTFYRAVKPILDKISENDETTVFPVMNAYFDAFMDGCNSKGAPKALLQPTIFGAGTLLFAEATGIVGDKFDKKYSTQNFSRVLEPVFNGVRSSILKNPGKSSKQLYEHLSKLLRDKTLRL